MDDQSIYQAIADHISGKKPRKNDCHRYVGDCITSSKVNYDDFILLLGKSKNVIAHSIIATNSGIIVCDKWEAARVEDRIDPNNPTVTYEYGPGGYNRPITFNIVSYIRVDSFVKRYNLARYTTVFESFQSFVRRQTIRNH